MRHTAVDEWSRGTSSLHQRAAGAKLLPLIVFLVTLATAHHHLPLLAAGLGSLLVAGIVGARLPLGGILARGAVVLPFSGLVAVVSWLAGDPARSLELILKSYLSALAVLLLAATTPMPDLLRCLEAIRVPGFLLTVLQFLYRYLFLVPEEAARMRIAAAARGGMTFRAAAGALAVLFVRSYSRGENIHRAMLARGFSGRFHSLATRSFTPADAAFLVTASAVPVAVRAAAELVH